MKLIKTQVSGSCQWPGRGVIQRGGSKKVETKSGRDEHIYLAESPCRLPHFSLLFGRKVCATNCHEMGGKRDDDDGDRQSCPLINVGHARPSGGSRTLLMAPNTPHISVQLEINKRRTSSSSS